MVIEVVTFSLQERISEAEFLDADAAVQRDAAPFCTGFVRRTTARDGDGGWAVITLWYDQRCADEGQDQIAAHPAGERLAEMVDGDTIVRRCYTSLD